MVNSGSAIVGILRLVPPEACEQRVVRTGESVSSPDATGRRSSHASV